MSFSTYCVAFKRLIAWDDIWLGSKEHPVRNFHLPTGKNSWEKPVIKKNKHSGKAKKSKKRS
jgi:hypothetical protein